MTPPTLSDVARAFIDYYARPDGCANCGGLPHATTCFVGRFAAALAAPGATVSGKYGAVDVERWRELELQGGRVLVAGVDVTDRCRWFNDLQGRAECLVLDEQGRPTVGLDDEVAVEILEGAIVVIPPGA